MYFGLWKKMSFNNGGSKITGVLSEQDILNMLEERKKSGEKYLKLEMVSKREPFMKDGKLLADHELRINTFKPNKKSSSYNKPKNDAPPKKQEPMRSEFDSVEIVEDDIPF